MHRILRIFRAPQHETLGRSRKFSVSEYLFSFSSFRQQYRSSSLWKPSYLSSLFFLSVGHLDKGERFRTRTFLPCSAIYSLLLENLEMIHRDEYLRYVNIRDVEKNHSRFIGHVVLNKYKSFLCWHHRDWFGSSIFTEQDVPRVPSSYVSAHLFFENSRSPSEIWYSTNME